ncbi:Uncharacterised protein [Mycobacterium tuberculosis]|nr:Uncharacterised protein [Mycobacterium tuberculosis]
MRRYVSQAPFQKSMPNGSKTIFEVVIAYSWLKSRGL